MVDNRGVSPVSSFRFQSGDISGTAAKTSEEKMGQGGEYFAQEIEEDEQEQNQNNYQDRSAQLRASLDGLAMGNAASIMLMKSLKQKKTEKKPNKDSEKSKNSEQEQEFHE